MPCRVFKFDFSKYTYIFDEENHDFRIYRYDEDITDRAMNNPLFDLLIAYNNLYEQTVSDVKNLRRGIIRDNVDISMSVDNDNTIHFVIKGINNGNIELLADDMFNNIDKLITYKEGDTK